MIDQKIRAAYWIFPFFCCLYVLSMGGHGYGGVGTTTYSVTRAMLLRKSVAIAPVPWGKIGKTGQFYAQYGIGHSLFNIPFYAVGHALAKLSPSLTAYYDRLTMLTTLFGQPVISALTCVLLFFVCHALGYSPRISLWCVYLYGLGTQAWMYAQLDFSEPILTFFLLATVYALYSGTKTETDIPFVAAGAVFGVAVTVKIGALFLLPVFFGYVLFSSKDRVRRTLLFSVPVLIIGGGVVGTYNFARFGNPLETGYDHEFNFLYGHVWRQFVKNLFSWEGSIFLYSPVILLAFPAVKAFYRQYARFALLLFGIILAFFLFYPFTTNELYYGPRYLTPTLPFFVLICGASLARRRKWLITILLIIGMAQQLTGVLVNYHTYYWRIQYTLPLADDALRTSEIGKTLLATPKLPPLSGHLWLIKEAVRHLFTPGSLPLSGVNLLPNSARQNAWIPYYGLDVWWCHPSVAARAGGILPLAISAALFGGMWLAFRRLFGAFIKID